MNQSTQAPIAQTTDGPGSMKVAILSSRWHKLIVDNAVEAVKSNLVQNGVEADCFEVPGAFELPLHARRLAQTGRYSAIIACGLITNGGIYQHEFVASAVIDGLMQVQLALDVPVFSAVLTPHNFHEHEEHITFFARHFVLKGNEVAQACLDTIEGLKNVAKECA